MDTAVSRGQKATPYPVSTLQELQESSLDNFYAVTASTATVAVGKERQVMEERECGSWKGKSQHLRHGDPEYSKEKRGKGYVCSQSAS